jgi:hypothetical protein
MLGTLIDSSALWHAALYAFVGSMAFVGAFGLAIFARDRAARGAAAWNLVLVLALAGCVGVFAVGVWAMAQKS